MYARRNLEMLREVVQVQVQLQQVQQVWQCQQNPRLKNYCISKALFFTIQKNVPFFVYDNVGIIECRLRDYCYITCVKYP